MKISEWEPLETYIDFFLEKHDLPPFHILTADSLGSEEKIIQKKQRILNEEEALTQYNFLLKHRDIGILMDEQGLENYDNIVTIKNLEFNDIDELKIAINLLKKRNFFFKKIKCKVFVKKHENKKLNFSLRYIKEESKILDFLHSIFNASGKIPLLCYVAHIICNVLSKEYEENNGKTQKQFFNSLDEKGIKRPAAFNIDEKSAFTISKLLFENFKKSKRGRKGKNN